MQVVLAWGTSLVSCSPGELQYLPPRPQRAVGLMPQEHTWGSTTKPVFPGGAWGSQAERPAVGPQWMKVGGDLGVLRFSKHCVFTAFGVWSNRHAHPLMGKCQLGTSQWWTTRLLSIKIPNAQGHVPSNPTSRRLSRRHTCVENGLSI